MQTEATMTVRERFPDEPLMKIKEAAKYLGIHERTMRSIRASGAIPVIHPSPGRIGIHPADLRQYIEDHREVRGPFGRRRRS
jgi:excisionase family DNA binding protein